MENCGVDPCDQSSLGLLNSVQSCRLEPCDQSKARLLNSMETSGLCQQLVVVVVFFFLLLSRNKVPLSPSTHDFNYINSNYIYYYSVSFSSDPLGHCFLHLV